MEVDQLPQIAGVEGRTIITKVASDVNVVSFAKKNRPEEVSVSMRNWIGGRPFESD